MSKIKIDKDEAVTVDTPQPTMNFIFAVIEGNTKDEFVENVNKALKDNHSIAGDWKIENGIYMLPMIEEKVTYV